MEQCIDVIFKPIKNVGQKISKNKTRRSRQCITQLVVPNMPIAHFYWDFTIKNRAASQNRKAAPILFGFLPPQQPLL